MSCHVVAFVVGFFSKRVGLREKKRAREGEGGRGRGKGRGMFIPLKVGVCNVDGRACRYIRYDTIRYDIVLYCVVLCCIHGWRQV